MSRINIRTIYVSWRVSRGEPRFIIAILKRSAGKGLSFSYLKDAYHLAMDAGLSHFFGFKDADTLTQNEIENLIRLRLIGKDRPERKEYLDFWEAGDMEDSFDELGLTQGLSPTDNFEFLADYTSVKLNQRSFVTDLASLSHTKLAPDIVKIGDRLTYELDTENKHDRFAVKVFHQGTPIGYVKKIHNKIFVNRGARKLDMVVKAVENNGTVKAIFVKVSRSPLTPTFPSAPRPAK